MRMGCFFILCLESDHDFVFWRCWDPWGGLLLAVTLEVFPINSFVPVKILTVMPADFPQNTARVSDSDNICRNILHNHTACTNDGIVPDCNTGNNHDAGSDPDIFPDVHVLIRPFSRSSGRIG